MDQITTVQTSWGPCVFRDKARMAGSQCEIVSAVVPHNRRCCEAHCGSPWRACRVCILQSSSIAPDPVIDPKTGLCEWQHTEQGETTVRPKVVSQAKFFSQVSLPSGPRPTSQLGSLKKGKAPRMAAVEKERLLKQAGQQLLAESGRSLLVVNFGALVTRAKTIGGQDKVSESALQTYFYSLSPEARAEMLRLKKVPTQTQK